jgi:hypothetical protein
LETPLELEKILEELFDQKEIEIIKEHIKDTHH